MMWFWQRKSDKQAECDASSTLCLPPELFSNPVLIRCMYKQLTCHAFNKQRFVFYELISPKKVLQIPSYQRTRDAKNGWALCAADHFLSAFLRHSAADSHCLKSSGWGTHHQSPSIITSQNSSKKCLGFCRLSSPFIRKHPFKPQTRRLAVITGAWRSGRCSRRLVRSPWMFDQNCVLLTKSSISQLGSTNTLDSPQVSFSCLPSAFLCILTLCILRHWNRLPQGGGWVTIPGGIKRNV